MKTEKHPSKNFVEITIEDEEIKDVCKNHHSGEESANKLLPIVKYFDQLAAYISRKNVLRKNGRYDYENSKINFQKLAKDIEERQHSAKLYYNDFSIKQKSK